MRTSSIAVQLHRAALATILSLTASACPRPKDEDGGKDDGARDSATGTDDGAEPKPAVKTESPNK